MKKGYKFKLVRSVDDIWIARSEAEIQSLRDRDASLGRWHDDCGEPLLYGKYSGWDACGDIRVLNVTVTTLRPKWHGLQRRPRYLRAGFCTELKCEVLFRF